MMNLYDPWIVDLKGGPDEYFEIAVVRSSNSHGIKSYGWFDERKVFVSGSGGPCHYKVDQFVWDRLVKVAEELAERLNGA